MKKSILIISIVVLAMLHANATSNTTMPKAPVATVKVSESNLTKVFKWKVKTTRGSYSGTSSTLVEAKKMIALSSSGEIITGTEIVSYYVLKSDITLPRNYFWEVKTATSKARGYASSETYAHKMIALVASGDAIVSKLIISQPQQ